MQPIHRILPFLAVSRDPGPFLRALLALAALSFLTGLQPPPPTATGSGEIELLATTRAGAPAAGLTVRYLDEWQRHPYGVCTTDAAGRCLLMVQDAPALHGTLRGQLDTGGARRREVLVPVGTRVRVALTLERDGSPLTGGTDVLATRDPSLTPTLIAPDAALATLTALADDGIATPSPGVQRTIAAAHARMSATAVTRSGDATLAPTVTLTPGATGTLVAGPEAASAPEGDVPATPGPAILLAVALLTVTLALLVRWRHQSQKGGAS